MLNPVDNQLLNLLAVLLHYPHPNQVKRRLPNPLGTLRCNRVHNRQRDQPLCRVVSRLDNHRHSPLINQVHNLLINQIQCPVGSLLRFQAVALLCNQQDNLHLSLVSFRRPNPAPNHLLNLAVNQLESLHPNQVIDQVPHLLDFLVGFQVDNPAPTPVDIRHPNQALNQVLSQLHFLQASQLVNRAVAQVRSLAVNQQLFLPVNPVRYPRVSRLLYQHHFQRDHHQEFLQIFPLLNHRPPHQINRPGIRLLNRLLYQVKDHRLFQVADLRIFQLLCHLLFLQTRHLVNLAEYRLRYQRTDPVPTPHLHHLFNQVVNHLLDHPPSRCPHRLLLQLPFLLLSPHLGPQPVQLLLLYTRHRFHLIVLPRDHHLSQLANRAPNQALNRLVSQLGSLHAHRPNMADLSVSLRPSL